MGTIGAARDQLRKLMRLEGRLLEWAGTAAWMDWTRGAADWLSEAWTAVHLVGVGVVRKQDGEFLEVYVRFFPPQGVQRLLQRRTGGVPLKYVVSPGFKLLAGPVRAGDSLTVDGGPVGTIGPFLTDNSKKKYAVSCAHVLDAEEGRRVLGPDGTSIGTVSKKVALEPDKLEKAESLDPKEPNRVDCGLVELSANTEGRGGQPGNLFRGAEVNIGGPTPGQAKVRSVDADIVATWDRSSERASTVYFDNVVIAFSKEAAIQPGSSGSPVTFDGQPAGIVFAGPSIVKVGSGGHGTPDDMANVAICDLGKIIAELTAEFPKELAGLRLL